MFVGHFPPDYFIITVGVPRQAILSKEVTMGCDYVGVSYVIVLSYDNKLQGNTYPKKDILASLES